jgi:3-oxoacyl-[acyl-carrier protein] reductase
MPDELAGRVAVVTGSSRRIGRAIAEAFARRGAAVMVHGKTSGAEAEAVAAGIRSRGGQAASVLADISTPDGAAHLAASTLAAFGRTDILVNNAAVRRRVPLEQLTYAEWRDVVSIILDGAFLCTSAFLEPLKSSGHGRIITIGGAASFTGSAHHAHVISAKAGLVGLTRALAHDLGPFGVTANLVSPGLIETPDDDPKRVAERRSSIPLDKIPVGRVGTPADVAEAVATLAGDQFSYMTGQIVHLNGGLYMG